MTDEPDPRDALFRQIAASIGGANVQMLNAHHDCTCVGCQLYALGFAVEWACHAEPLEQIAPSLDSLLRDLFVLRRIVRQQTTWHAMTSYIGAVEPETDGRPN